MYRLNDERFAAARPIFEKYRAKLHNTGKFNAQSIERELRQCWKATSRDVKDIFLRLSKTGRYKFLAAYYMEHSDAGKRPLTEFWPTLSVLYGIPYYRNPLREPKRKAFWSKLRRK